MSHTSLPSHTGPTEAKTWRRSASVFATRRWMAPAPRSKPSSRTYTVIMMATRQNQIVPIPAPSIRGDGKLGIASQNFIRIRPALDLPVDQEEPQDPEHRVHAHEPDQREPRVAGADLRRDP